MEDIEDPKYQNDLKDPVDSSFVEGQASEEAVIQGDIEGGRRKKNRRTRKIRKSRITKKNKKSKRSKTRKH